MIDEAYSLDLLPSSLKNLTFSGANSIEANLRYLILQFPYFSASIRNAALGSYGYLELTEAACAGDGFDIESAIRIDKITITVSGLDLSSLDFQGAGWLTEEEGQSSLVVVYLADSYMDTFGIQFALDQLFFTSSTDLDASITLQVSNTSEGAFMPLGPVIMRFRSGATWALIEGKKLTWNDIEEADMTWDDLESLKK